MKRTVSILLFVILTLSLFVLASCTQDEPQDKSYRVMISYSEGARVTSENPVTVKEGEDAVFTVAFDEGYLYKSSAGAEYSPEDGTLTVRNIRRNTNVDLIAERADYDLNAKLVYVFKPDSELDSSSVPPGRNIKAGTSITLTAGDSSRLFTGWSVGAKIDRGGKVISFEREYTFTLTPSLAVGDVVTVYANYLDADTLIYDANGGTVNKGSYNLTKNDFYDFEIYYGSVSVTYGEEYLSYFECGSSFFDDGSFTREGYLLREYNTRPDGSGVSYSLGSKVPMLTDGEGTVLYCIWAECTPSTDFAFEEVTLRRPVSVERAPHWVERGVVITEYLGNADEVVIPEEIDGKTVTAIATGAFTNKSVRTLQLSRRMIRVEDGAFVGCSSLKRIYYPDGLYYMSDLALDEASYESFTDFFVNATLAPRFDSSDVGALSVKLSRMLAPTTDRRVVVISGSSSLQGLGSEYLEALLGEGYRVVNFGTTRTTHGAVYLEAMGALAREGDVIIYAPENSAYMFGESELYYKLFRDLEGMVNIYRLVDFSSYRGMFSSMTDLNQNYRYEKAPLRYESVSVHGELTVKNPTYVTPTTNKYGDFLKSVRKGLVDNYHDTYFITLNERVKSRFEGGIYDDTQIENKDYRDPDNVTWASVTDAYYADVMNMAIARAKASGAGVYFGFCPVDAEALVEGADALAWIQAYDRMIDDTYDFDGRIGSAYNYIFDHSYFYDCAFHPNDYGRTYRTYRLYVDLCEKLGIGSVKNLRDEGTDFEGCLFEDLEGNLPGIPWIPGEES